jgi:hypothetical protein
MRVSNFFGRLLIALALVLSVNLVPVEVEAGWKTKVALVVAAKAIPYAIKASTPAIKKKSIELVTSTIQKHPEILPQVEQKIVAFIKKRPELKSQGLKLLKQIRPRSALPPARLAKDWRAMPGKALGKSRSHIKAGSKWLRGSHGNAGSVPGQIADKLHGRSFRNFNEFRSEFWKSAGNDPVLAKGWSRANISRMKKRKAPFSSPQQATGSSKSYHLHHKTPISRGGGVYDLDNIQVLTPRMHREILEKGFHYGK